MDKRIEKRSIREIMARAPKVVGPRTGLRALKTLFEMHDFNAFPLAETMCS
ncbi:MAG: hypothetical protein HYY64_05260 [Candidatus Rokubacteria bacterium]|nr:hypothetical protein [Candidatus Rokubacteria bacterium]